MEANVKSKSVQWEILVAAAAVVFTILGVVVPLFIHIDNKFYQLVQNHYQEMKEFRSEK